ncbi:Golgi transport complex subunit COG6 PWA37_000781 [Arxiozyma heterogenica]|uniref:Conserved oligomeric Golgi complex subunit 6 n=1 Tax=Arxiozyma heterogenica TaxID=278026 RepID=A0AAN7WT93_9SACH|nr:hypothetical protein RI543_002307 [Kazachstania heterogenica]
MDFLDFQTFSFVDTATNENNSLPSPGQGLKLSSSDSYLYNNNNDNYTDNTLSSGLKTDDAFELPNLSQVKINDKNSNQLSSKMANYVKMSIKELNLFKESSSYTSTNTNTNTNMEPSLTNDLLNKPIDINKLLNRDQTSLEATNQVLSKKLSVILNERNINNYHQTIKLRKALSLLEDTNIVKNETITTTTSNSNNMMKKNQKKNSNLEYTQNYLNISLDIDNLVSADYVGILSRKNLKYDIETQLLKEHITILEDFRPVIRRIKRLCNSVDNIKEVKLQLTSKNENEKEKNILSDIDKIKKDLKLLKLKQQILLRIKDTFTLNQVEEDIIQNGNITTNSSEFFEVIDKIESIREGSSYLLALDDQHAGKALISKLNVNLEMINRKIFNHLLSFLYDYNSITNTDLPIYRKCLIYLSNDLSFFDSFIKHVTTERSKLILDEFLSQFDLNVRDKKPVLLNAHDPIRYIGDVLASIHSLIANEADFIKILFSFQDEKETETNSNTNNIKDESKEKNFYLQYKSINIDYLKGLDTKLLNEIVQSLANSCRIRIEQIVRFEESCTISFEIIQLLRLYRIMFEKKSIEKSNNLIVNLEKLITMSNEKIQDHFVTFIKENKSTKLEYNNDTDLLPPDWLFDYLNELTDFLRAYSKNNSMEDYSTKNSNKQSVAEQDIINENFIVQTIEEPFQKVLIGQIQAAFPLAKKKEEVKILFLTVQVNCFDLIKTRLQIFKESIFNKDEKISQIYENIETKLDTLISNLQNLQTKLLLEKTGLSLYNNLLNMIFPIDQVEDELDYDMYLSLKDNDLMCLPSINNNVHNKLNEYLPQVLTELQETLLFKLASPEIADHICEYCFKRVSRFYSVFRKVLTHINPEQKEEVCKILNFTEDDFNILLGITNDK